MCGSFVSTVKRVYTDPMWLSSVSEKPGPRCRILVMQKIELMCAELRREILLAQEYSPFVCVPTKISSGNAIMQKTLKVNVYISAHL